MKKQPTPTKLKRGRPTSYDPKFCDQIVAYFERAAKAKPRKLAPIETTQTGRTGYKKMEVRRICAELPTLEGFARSIKVSTSMMARWTAEFPEFREAHTRAKDIQKCILVDRGLNRQYDPTAFIFVAKNITDMTDKQVLAGVEGGPAIQLVVMQAGQRLPDEAQKP